MAAMAVSRRPNDNRNDSDSQATRRAYAPAEVVALLDLREIKKLWGVGVDRVYRAVERGELRAYGRPGRQKYYAAAEVTACFGEPGNLALPGDQTSSRKLAL